jgi:hypothetical protein
MAQVAAALQEPNAGQARPTLVDALREDAHWQRFYWQERYWRPEFSYEEYAPAYCVGYVGFAQYGGSFEDAERSLVANWLRIRGDSRLGMDDAAMAMRAAWRRMENNAANPRSLPAMQALAADAFDGAAREPHQTPASQAAMRPTIPAKAAPAAAEVRVSP